MSRIGDFIAESCRAGVEFRALSDCVARPQSIKWSEHLGERFQYIDLASVDRVTHKIVDTAEITSDNAPSRAQQIVRTGDVIFGTTRPTLKRYAVISPDYDGQICSTGFCVLRPNTKVVLTNYLFHLLGAEEFLDYVERHQRGAGYPAISDTLVKRYRIPVPPLEVQREVVKVLDTFAELDAELEAGLEAELEERRQQYEHYRDSLLTFPEEKRVRWVAFGEAATIVRGGSPRPIQKYLTDSTDGVNWIKIGDVAAGGKYITSTSEKITQDGALKSRRVEPGDFVLSNSMSFGRPYIVDIDGCIHDGWLSIKDFTGTFLPDFLYHLLRTTRVYKEMAQRAGAGTVKNLNAEIVKRLLLPVPPFGEQEQIVAILDKFDALVNDLSVGLSAELNARRKQYEHYRGRLLAFPEAA